ncbi:putative U3 small nucleolar RNA-associated protein 11 [Labeo rohita]|uniref:Probable U3 small nucleolar RNA-associated protein 11 n=1 Tax=Labeo rohita TaxID=84645 RepID=A0ABQ8LWQ5_LABRO|nr:putative U3 small nucleolar RNA-associated protein 11 [Labeo rohita]
MRVCAVWGTYKFLSRFFPLIINNWICFQIFAAMSSFRKALKSKQRDHKERSQLGFRKHLGLLEKKKDYKLRAEVEILDFSMDSVQFTNRCVQPVICNAVNTTGKEKTLMALQKKAMDKNPDEFHFKMIHNHLKDGVHMIKTKEDVMTEEQKKVMRTQDIRYVEMKRVSEMKKIERMKSELHFLDVNEEKKNKHVFYVESKKEVEDFDLATHLNTVPELVGRVYNRPTIETLEKKSIVGELEPLRIKKRELEYRRLSQRIDREKDMFVISQKIQTRKDLQDKVKKVKVREETKSAPAVYRFEAKRKR